MIITHDIEAINSWLEETLSGLLSRQKDVYIALPGGTSLDDWYRSIVLHGGSFLKKLDTTRIFWGIVDERRVPSTDPESNSYQCAQKFFTPLIEKGIIPSASCIFPDASQDPIEYMERMRIPDVALLGVGEDGHIASLFPGHGLLGASIEGYVCISDAPKTPPKRITITRKSLEKVAFTCIFFRGKGKKDAWNNFCDEKISIEQCPAKMLHPSLIHLDDSIGVHLSVG